MKHSFIRISYCGLIVLLILAFTGCRQDSIPYEQEIYWFDTGRKIDAEKADVFYILPTCVWDWTDSLGNIHHYADPLNQKQREDMEPSYILAEDIFADSCNFFAPYYRQITLECWMEEENIINERFGFAMQDINDAFKYYLDNFNNGRPFILAGFSQGAKAVVELLKGMDENTAGNLIAAYVIGYSVSEEDLKANPAIKPAMGEFDTGVTVCYSTVTEIEAISPALSFSSICINPVNWTTDTVKAELNDSTSITVDREHNVLIASGINEDRYYIPELGKLFKPGNLHLQELYFYEDFLRRNVKSRCSAF